MSHSLDSFKLKIFDKYLADTGSSYDGFLAEKKLVGSAEADITKAKLQTIDEAIEIMGKEALFKNYLSDADFKLFKDSGQ